MMKPIYDHIPDELKQYSQWVNWRAVERDGKVTKPPYQPDGNLAGSNNPATWRSFSVVKDAAPRFDGVGFVLTQESPFIGLDFDMCYCPAFNLTDPTVEQHIRGLNSYTEISPSGKGIRVMVKGKIPVDGKRKGQIEAYQSGRYVTITGHRLEGFPRTIENRQNELDEFYQVVFSETTKKDTTPKGVFLSATPHTEWQERLEKAFRSKNGSEIRKLWEGDHSAYASPSEADMALCSHLSFWLDGDPALMDAAFRQSSLYREKWDKNHYTGGHTYGEATIDKAVSGCHAFYSSVTQPQEKGELDPIPPVDWPAHLDKAAYFGLAGEYVRMLDPHTESDPAAILSQVLVSFGNIIGRAPYFTVEADRHYTNEFLLIVGNTAKARKGTSFGHVRRLFSGVEEDWTQERIKSGLISGEGLIYHVRDRMKDDEGVSDKRMLAYESEFANVLKVIERRENTLSTTLRQAWDTGNLRTLAKNTPVKASHAHISLISHITKEELKRRMSEAEAFNGFANRFIFVCAKRSKLLPEGGNIQALDFSRIEQGVNEAVKFSQTVGELRRDEEARAIWHEVYRYLTRDIPGLLGAVISRADAHVLRLSMLYALLDLSRFIRKPHIMAALALWEYSEASAQYIFESFTGDNIADKIYIAAKEAGADGITRTFVCQDLLQRHANRERIDKAISLLVNMGKIRVEKTTTGGRPEIKYYAT
jgi:hypothetical protein